MATTWSPITVKVTVPEVADGCAEPARTLTWPEPSTAIFCVETRCTRMFPLTRLGPSCTTAGL